MSVHTSIGVIVRPHSADEVSKYARSALRVADAVGQLPTPIDDLLAAAKLKLDLPPPSEQERNPLILRPFERT